eukprot:CAMPEP_0196820812 /NCGR_PEP_ID=MMETSP1362-20130617/76725_1 /TAXON_ID=163516 /ORGANISM="Leptocylindrus danicus, Strain CCMP1856" /LENGTH=175 /DNA_ID=CAMNT_0042199815 /DNA_START=105 /DNA_END=632 /DNA_ORIENTATION=-
MTIEQHSSSQPASTAQHVGLLGYNEKRLKKRIINDRQLQLALQVVCLNHRALRPPSSVSDKHQVPWSAHVNKVELAKIRWDLMMCIEELIFSWIHPRVASKLRNHVVEVASMLEKTVFYTSFSIDEYLSYRKNLEYKVDSWVRSTAVKIAEKRTSLQRFLPELRRSRKSFAAAAA